MTICLSLTLRDASPPVVTYTFNVPVHFLNFDHTHYRNGWDGIFGTRGSFLSKGIVEQIFQFFQFYFLFEIVCVEEIYILPSTSHCPAHQLKFSETCGMYIEECNDRDNIELVMFDRNKI